MSDYLAMFDNYLINRKNSRFDLDIAIDLLWGDLQNPLLSDDLLP